MVYIEKCDWSMWSIRNSLYCRKFVKDVFVIVRILIYLIKKNVFFKWIEDWYRVKISYIMWFRKIRRMSFI